jgi:DNA-binding transcriptional ArsR family regulator
MNRVVASPRLELFLAVCAAIGMGDPPVVERASWGRLVRRGDRSLLSRLRSIRDTEFWLDLAHWTNRASGSPEADPVDLLESAPLAGLSDAEEQRFTVIDCLRRFQRQVFLPFWRQVSGELETAVERLRPGLAALSAAQISRCLGLPVSAIAVSEPLLLVPTVFPAQARRYCARLDPGSVVSVLPFDPGAVRLEPPPPTAIPAPPVAVASRPADPDAALVFRALGDATRYAVAMLLAREALTGAELARRLNVSKPTMTHHLRQLRQARLLREERRGTSIVSRLDRDAVAAISETAIRQFFDEAGSAPLSRSRRPSTS